MRISILGPLRLEEGGRVIPLGGARQQAVLAYLALRVNEIVPAEQLLAEVWGETGAPESTNALQAVVSRVRKVLPPGRLVTRSGGYVLRLLPREFDAAEFEETFAEGRTVAANSEPAEAARILRHALSLWRGPALVDFRYDSFAQADIARLDELRLACTQARIEAELATGAGADLVAELTTLVADHPLREALRGQLMRALYRSGRQAEALEAFHVARNLLDKELGISPSASLVDLEAAILRHDPCLDVARDPAAATAASPVRRLVTVLCVDVVMTSANGRPLDPEAVNLVDARVRALFSPVVARYGGRLLTARTQPYQAIFGSDSAHEDDAQRAALAAVDCRDCLSDHGEVWACERGLRLESRFGVATADALITGPAPSDVISESGTLAQRLAMSARPGQVLISAQTYSLAPGALDVLPGVAGSYSLLSARFGSRPVPISLDAPLIGRRREMQDLCGAFEQAEHDRRTVLTTVLGEAGIGKTRLVHEFTGQLTGRVSTLTGRCLPYGDAITFWPLREIVHQATGGDHSPKAIENLLNPEPDAAVIAGRLSRAFGVGAPGTADSAEIFWATRKLFEALGREHPLLVVMEDLHWADSIFLDLVESLSVQPPAVPLVVLCVARPELLELRPNWPTTTAGMIELKRLDAAEANALVDALTATTLTPTALTRSRLLDAAGGNPLYLEQLVAWWEEQAGSEEAALPPTIQALLAARLDLLERDEREVLACASVLGKDFRRESIRDLLPAQARAALPRHLRALSRKGLIHLADPDRHEKPHPGRRGKPEGEFRHGLIQQAAYRAIPKARRAELHEQVSDAMEALDRDGSTQWIEVLAHHLEQATRYRRELQHAELAAVLAARATGYLLTAGDSSLALGNAAAAERQYNRAADLQPESHPDRARILVKLGIALYETGRLQDAKTALDTAERMAERRHDDRLTAEARVQSLTVSLHLDPENATTLVEPELPGLRTTFATHADDVGLSHLWHLQAAVHWNRARSAEAEQAWEHAAEHARTARDRRQVAWSLVWLASAALWGPTPAMIGIARCRQYLQELGDIPSSRAVILLHEAGLHAMTRDMATAADLLARGSSTLEEIGSSLPLTITEPASFVAMLAGDLSLAEHHLQLACEMLRKMGDQYELPTATALLARVLALQGPDRYDEADELVTQSWQAGADEDLSARIVGNGVRARIVAARGDGRRAIKLGQEAVALAARTDLLNQHGDALMDLAFVRACTGNLSGATRAARQALALYRRKGNRASAEPCEKYLAKLGSS